MKFPKCSNFHCSKRRSVAGFQDRKLDEMDKDNCKIFHGKHQMRPSPLFFAVPEKNP